MKKHPWSTPVAALLAGLAGLSAVVATPEPTQVRITTEPAGAVVTCDGELRDAAPITLAGLLPGEHLLTAALPGYREARQTVELSAGQRMAVSLVLEQIVGLVLIHSEPAGADVEVDGAHRGRTPLLLADLPLGTYRARLTLAGFLAREVELTIRDRTPQRELVRLTSDSATLVLASDPTGAQVTLNGIARGTTPCTLDRIPGGDNRLELTMDGYEAYVQDLRLIAGKRETVTAMLTPIPAELTVVSLPAGARVYVADQYRGDTPLVLKPIDPGTYRIRTELPGHAPMARSVRLERAQALVEEFRMQGNTGVFELTTEPAGVKVFVDGKEVGSTAAPKSTTDRISEPLQLDLLPVGTHQVQLTCKGYYAVAFPIEIARQQTVSMHHKLKRRFIPNIEVRTRTEVYKGVLMEVEPTGDVQVELRPGIVKTIPAADIVSRRPLREE